MKLNEPTKNMGSESEQGTLQLRFNKILGKYAKVRGNVSIGEDRRLHMEALWDKYGQ